MSPSLASHDIAVLIPRFNEEAATAREPFRAPGWPAGLRAVRERTASTAPSTAPLAAPARVAVVEP